MGLIFNMFGIIGIIVIIVVVPILFYIMIRNMIDKRRIPKEVIEGFDRIIKANSERRAKSYETARTETYDPTKKDGGAGTTTIGRDGNGGGDDGREINSSVVKSSSISPSQSKTNAKHSKRIKFYKYEPRRS